MKLSRWLDRTLLAVGLLSSCAVALWIVVAAPQFGEVFAAFGAEVSPIGQFFVRFHLLFLLLPVLIWTVSRYWPYSRFRYVAAAGLGVFSAAVFSFVFTWAMYQPILKLGQTP